MWYALNFVEKNLQVSAFNHESHGSFLPRKFPTIRYPDKAEIGSW